MKKITICSGNLFDFDSDLFDDELYYLKNEDGCITEEDFYQLSDDRVWTSNIEDVDGGDNFADYCEYIFRLYEEEEYYDNWI